ncbi:hypothetical protein [Sphingomonas carotinifaciens]|nr:hypothetical protein [Sphingomonas carotinifaciens]MBB4085732.1 hypothetical protein [Sphingomonas carotinifaciens]
MSGLMKFFSDLFGTAQPAPSSLPSSPSPAHRPSVPLTPDRAPAGFSADDPRLPDAARPKVAELLDLATQIERRAKDDPLLVSALTEVRQMRDTHLPQLVSSYADIPPAHRAEIFRQTGRSASYVLTEGLEKMLDRLRALCRTMAQDNLDNFADNLRFIETRYGNRDPLG